MLFCAKVHILTDYTGAYIIIIGFLNKYLPFLSLSVVLMTEVVNLGILK